MLRLNLLLITLVQTYNEMMFPSRANIADLSPNGSALIEYGPINMQ